MSILEILEAHQLNSRHLLCACGDDVSPVDGADWLMDEVYSLHRAHVAQVLEQHEREAKAEAVRESARYLNHIMPNGLVNPIAVLADLDVAADRIGRGLHANGRDRNPS